MASLHLELQEHSDHEIEDCDKFAPVDILQIKYRILRY